MKNLLHICMKKWSLLVLLVAVFAVSGAVSAFAAVADDTISVGVVMPITGREGKPGQYQKEAIELAIKQINDRGGILVKGKTSFSASANCDAAMIAPHTNACSFQITHPAIAPLEAMAFNVASAATRLPVSSL